MCSGAEEKLLVWVVFKVTVKRQITSAFCLSGNLPLIHRTERSSPNTQASRLAVCSPERQRFQGPQGARPPTVSKPHSDHQPPLLATRSDGAYLPILP